jgi:mannobiose 2-epimerase
MRRDHALLSGTRILEAGESSYRALAGEVETVLREDVLEVWFPRCVNSKTGGFFSSYLRDWQRGTSEGYFSVFQARMLWVAAQVSRCRLERAEDFLEALQHGVKFLNDLLWDSECGGFFWGLNDGRKVSSLYTDGKHLYGQSFCIYALAAAYQTTHDATVLDLALRAFHWIDAHAHDKQSGGYFEWLTRDGQVVKTKSAAASAGEVPVARFPIGYKSMNTHIHLLEAFTALYRIWPDKELRTRVEELLVLVRDRICVEPGVMSLYFTENWRPIPGNDSYGHDIETAYLLIEAEEVLGLERMPETERMCKLLVDHALAYGWDRELGGFYQSGPAIGEATDRRKEWWVQMEGLNALLLMHERHGRQDKSYFSDFVRQWEFVRIYLRDAENHGFYEMVGADGRPLLTAKGRIWKCAYHDTRALLNVSARLHELARTGA